MTPQPLEIVERARRLRKDMHQEIAVVHEYPFPGIVAFNTHGKLSHLFQSLLDFVGNRMRLTGIRDRANYKEIGEGSDFAKIENFDARGFLGFRTASRQHPIGKFRWNG